MWLFLVLSSRIQLVAIEAGVDAIHTPSATRADTNARCYVVFIDLSSDPVFVFGDLSQMELDEAVAIEASLLVTTPKAAAHSQTFPSP
jgi:hypothetical protein